MSDINLQNFLRDLETDSDYPNPPIDEEEINELQWQDGGWGCVSPSAMLGANDDYSFLLDDTSLCVEDFLNTVTPPTAAIPPPIATMPDVRSPTAQLAATPSSFCSVQQKSAATERRIARAAANTKKKAKSKAAHTLSERKRRGRINEKMKSLHEIIPNSKKSDKVSMIDDACEYIKSAELLLEQGRQSYMQEMGMDMNPTMSGSCPAAAVQQVPFYICMAQAANLLGPMWNPQVTPGLYPHHQVQQLPNQDQQDQNQNP